MGVAWADGTEGSEAEGCLNWAGWDMLQPGGGAPQHSSCREHHCLTASAAPAGDCAPASPPASDRLPTNV